MDFFSKCSTLKDSYIRISSRSCFFIAGYMYGCNDTTISQFDRQFFIVEFNFRSYLHRNIDTISAIETFNNLAAMASNVLCAKLFGIDISIKSSVICLISTFLQLPKHI